MPNSVHRTHDRPALRHFFQLARPYWVSEDRKAGWGLLLLVLSMNLALVWVNVRLNYWNNAFYDSLQHHDFAAFKHLLLVFSGYAFGFIVLAVYSQYFLQMLEIRWRRWVTEVFMRDWLQGGTHYRIALAGGAADNPDQRIADDIRDFVATTLSLFFGFVSSLVTLLSFVTILWTLSGAMTLWGWSIPGYMVWVALVYAGLGSWIAHRVGVPLVALNFEQQKFEADFRFGLARTREHNEGIALYRGEARELEGHSARFARVWGNWWAIMKRRKRFTWFTSFYGQLAIIFPILVAAPRYFSGQIQLGGLTQIADAFGQVQGSLSWFINAYTDIASWRATQERLVSFMQQVADARGQPLSELLRGAPPSAAPQPAADGAIRFGDLALSTPDGRLLLQAGGQTIEPGQHTLLLGASGLGKSTLLRWLAGIWPYASGSRAQIPAGSKLFLPQKPYLPIGTLAQALSYPNAPQSYSTERLREVLSLARLPALAASLDSSDNWMARLSPGEQQRLGFARALLAAPDWLFLDEASSALDPATERAMYSLLREQLPGTTLVSVAHRDGVRAFHQQLLELKLAPGSDLARLGPFEEPPTAGSDEPRPDLNLQPALQPA